MALRKILGVFKTAPILPMEVEAALAPPQIRLDTVTRKKKNPKEIVAAHHQEEFYNTNWETTTFIYTDASYMEDSKGVGVSVVATDQRGTIMEKLAINTGDGNLVYNGELEGITQGIEYGSLQARPGHSFRIFSDNQAALHRLAKLSDLPGQDCQIRAIAAAKKIKEKDAKISISWIPGHSQIRGNVKADGLAKKASKLEPLNNETSFASIKFHIANMRNEQWIKYLRKNDDNPRLSRSVYRRKFDWKIISKPLVPRGTRRDIASAFFQLKLGHGYNKKYLYQLGHSNTNQCRCGSIETPEHLIDSCSANKDARHRLKEKLNGNSLTFQLLLHTVRGIEKTVEFLEETNISTRKWHLNRLQGNRDVIE
ncbi:hypothetical protein EV44_g3492 [Erysiphe necator]|uniref:ribonuclease H n=1 Tax=Uncinula necator TaxID=52586 RepID=A0A0B1P839_UNCNE|nr:hypothetical protein EV44_g3492 [Erysiphe necator]